MYTLICSQFGEPQVDYVCDIIKSKGGVPVLFERYKKDHYLTYSYINNTIETTLKIEGKKYPLRSDVFPWVWHRMKPVLSSEIPGEKSNLIDKFCAYEWQHALGAMNSFLPDSKWINKIDNAHIISRKAIQLKLAVDCGLTIPATVITNHAESIVALFNKNDVIYKTLSSFFTKTDAIYTNKINANHIFSNLDTIAMAPGIFQKLIQKRYELRVTVVAEKIHIVKIDSQKKSDTLVDWRRQPSNDMYSHGLLSEKTTQQLFNFHKRAGLIFAAYDFIVDLAGNEIFLECNPGGQWLWLEKALDGSDQINVSDALATELTTI